MKKQIIRKIFYALDNDFDKIDGIDYQISVRNDEKYIDFTIFNRDFTVNLVEHRQKKGE